MKHWMNLGVSGQCGWPTTRTEIIFGEQHFVLLPCTKESVPSIHMEIKSHGSNEELTVVNRFLSVVSWAYKDSLQNEYGWSGNTAPMPVPKPDLAIPINEWFLTKWSPLSDTKQRLAVALYREATSLNSVPYQFLGYFKIINILYKLGPEQIAWIRGTLPKLKSPAKERIKKLSQSVHDVATYLYESGRCAIAHAFSDPLVDPDDITHLHRLSADMDVARALAEYIIKYELGVPGYP
jgi:hypothetical protein